MFCEKGRMVKERKQEDFNKKSKSRVVRKSTGGGGGGGGRGGAYSEMRKGQFQQKEDEGAI